MDFLENFDKKYRIRRSNFRKQLFVLFCSTILMASLIQVASQDSKCSFQTTCSKCITAGPNCAWCKSQNRSLSSQTRCDTADRMMKKCKPNDIINPQMFTDLLKNEPLSKPGVLVKNMVQLMPQKVSLRIRPNSPRKIQLKFRQAEDYPVDLYYLMDLSQSMKDDKDKLAALGSLLGTTMGNITKNFQLGYGSFVDKKAAPFVSEVPQDLLSPCKPGCAAPYGYINHMKLTENTARFVQEVHNSQNSGNLDTPEGTFDAIMQAVVCKKEIGWRDKARKILLVATDAGFHFAGSGKLAGILQPNDCQCHLNSDGLYTESTLQDYPSVSQVKNKIRENSINVLFAVTSNAFSIYEELARIIEGSHSGQLAENSDNIIELVKEQYKRISSTVELKDTSSSNIRVTYYTSCLNPKGKMKQTSICKGLKVGNTVDYEVVVEVASCPTNPKDRKQSFQISPVGLSETMVIDLELICDCDCENPKFQELNSGTCSNLGTYECGICRCPNNRFGEFCQCDRQKVADETDDTLCKKDNSSVACSGRGDCLCGTCSCFRPNERSGDKQIYGVYCECDNFNCAWYNNLICGGSEQGECDCGHCKCQSGWTGEACECPSTVDNCIGKHGEICSGKGNCECGKCKCDQSFGGRLCEDNITPGGKCYDYRLCAQCAAFPKQSRDNDCKSCNYSIEVISELGEPKNGEYRCSFKDDDGCHFFFIYGVVDDNIQPLIRVQEERECPVPVNLPLVMSIVAGGIVAIGLLLLLLWKLFTSLHDRREFAKFEKERLQAKWEKAENPIYKDAVTKFSNPTYNAMLDED